MLHAAAPAIEQFAQYTHNQRSASRSQVTLPAEDVEELKLWLHDVERNPNVKKATKSPIDMLKAPERAGTVAVRYWRFRTGAATNISLDEIVELVVARRNDPALKPPKEILFHRGLLAIFQAAALGQTDVRFEVEDFAQENKAREDVRTFATLRRPPSPVQRSCNPNENKRTWHCSNVIDQTGISQNKEALSKVWKCIRVHMPDEMEEQSSIVGTISSRFELLFFAEFEVRRRHDGSFELSAVYLAPCPPRSQLSAGGDCLWLVPDLDARLLALEYVKKDERTLAAVLPPEPLEGFTAAVSYADHIAETHNIAVATLQLHPGTFSNFEDGGFSTSSQADPIDLDDSRAFHGPNSVVLRPLGANYVVKIADLDKIMREVELHRAIDTCNCRYLRKALLDLSGKVEGAGPGLAGIVLEGFLHRKINANDCAVDGGKLGIMYFGHVEAALAVLHGLPVHHRDVKPSNILLSQDDDPRNRIAILNDFGESCWGDEFVKGGYCRRRYTSPNADAGGFSTPEDDYISLGLTFAHLHNLRVSDPYSPAGKMELIGKLCGLHENYRKCLGRFLAE
ncbi:Protein kinase-like domain containing protein [Klebsormidium nitens]|uniref:Protein kinase-like domain containing protein n=1 Tax=Klebsormidium nitens TaxID=105231 RepID=A0A1Y1I420_KLENI|nr:Protein kinase-like domain containing protein [Klebsormidium nitens]|eukprot:GAQ85680.1 Protein kinase-like domain containing protein [Klebsormidium nitens]